jgi:hypothetical protein
MAAASMFNFTPCCCNAAKKPGPSCKPMVKTNRISDIRARSGSIGLEIFVEEPGEFFSVASKADLSAQLSRGRSISDGLLGLR